MAADRGAIVHVDAIQSIGKLPINVSSWPVQLVSLSAHKFHGPKGVGALVVRRRTRLTPLIVGGGQEEASKGQRLWQGPSCGIDRFRQCDRDRRGRVAHF